MSFDKQALAEQLQRLPDTTRWIVGLSGGVDSVVLLHALLALETPEPVVAIHVNHGMSVNARRWQTFCEDLCDRWQVPLQCVEIGVDNKGRGLEDAARQARYEVFTEQMQQGDMLLLAHHLDDQAETLLFRLMRGAGPYGLSAMDDCRPFAQGYIARPLLPHAKHELVAYAEQHQLEWVEDDSNDSLDFDRNYLRHQVMPLLEERWPGFAERWQHTAQACQQADQMCHDLSLLDLDRCDEQRERWGYSLCAASLALLPRYRRNNLLRNWVRARGYSLMEYKHLQEVDKQLFKASASGAAVQWGDAALRLYGDRLYLTISDLPPWDKDQTLNWSVSGELELPDGGRLEAAAASQGLRSPDKPVVVCRRQGGERCRPVERSHSQTLKKLLQEFGLEPWLRDHVPLIYEGDQLIAVGDLWVCEGFEARAGEPAVALTWQLPN